MKALRYLSFATAIIVTVSFNISQESFAQSSRQQDISNAINIEAFGNTQGVTLPSRGTNGNSWYGRKNRRLKNSYTNPIKHYNLAVKFIEQNKLDKAEKLLFKALENPGLHKEVFYQLAVISDIRGEDDKKQQYLRSFYATLDAQHPAWREQSGL